MLSCSLLPLAVGPEDRLHPYVFPSHAHLQDLMDAHALGAESTSSKVCREKYSEACPRLA